MGDRQAVTDPLIASEMKLLVERGSSVPVTLALAERHRLTGVDVSARQVALARSNVPGAVFVNGDIMGQAFAADSFDTVMG